VIVRSAVPSREIGHLPGTLAEKLEIYSLPYKAILAEIFSKDSALKILESSGVVEVISTSFVRGITLENCLVVVDESSNLTFHELDSIITRIGKNSRIFFSGDYDQSDLHYKDRNGFNAFMNIISKLSSFSTVKFTLDDIVRSDIVKEYLIEKERHFSEDR
jgi:phosphate starvation-inducible protein PhoH